MRELAGARLIERDYAKQSLTVAELENILDDDPLPPFLNTRHALYKERNFAAQLPTRAELIKLLVAEPNLLRRPITRCGRQLVIGFDKDRLAKLAA